MPEISISDFRSVQQWSGPKVQIPGKYLYFILEDIGDLSASGIPFEYCLNGNSGAEI